MKRINAITSFIFPYRNIADIGCDHGYTIKNAFDLGLIDYAYAIDNKEGPIKSCMENLKNYDNVKYFLSDGMTSVDDKINCVIISGMGGMLIISILDKNKEKLKNVDRLILQANKGEYALRKYLTSNGFYLYDEVLVEEDNKFYEIDCFEKGSASYTFEELYFGKILISKRQDEFVKKWSLKYEKYKNIKAYYTDEEKVRIREGIEKILCK